MNDKELTYLFCFLEEHDIDSIIKEKTDSKIMYTIKTPGGMAQYALSCQTIPKIENEGEKN